DMLRANFLKAREILTTIYMMIKSTFTGKFTKTLFFLALIFIAGCDNNQRAERERELQKAVSTIDSLTAEVKEEKIKTDSLQSLLMEKEMFVKSDTVYFGPEFSEIPNPAETIKKALKARPELIPMESVLGGEMQFRKITILSDSWLFAMYDDGHVQGKSLIEYKLQPDGELQFEILVSESP
ncbi:MAG TPA: hypothetical protein VFI78_07110, partial [Salinimicrobium sp.]|nr:hypothetical protein [Salinimicrobium sp.]